jgi:hypothetical protein
MGVQQELFETGKRRWRKRVCQSIAPETQWEVISVLARMGVKDLQSARDAKKEQRKESDDES